MILEGGRNFDLGPNRIIFDSATQFVNAGANGIDWNLPAGDRFSVEINSSVVFELQEDEIGFYGSNPVAKPTVTGSRSGNAALADLLTELDNMGLITDSSTA